MTGVSEKDAPVFLFVGRNASRCLPDTERDPMEAFDVMLRAH